MTYRPKGRFVRATPTGPATKTLDGPPAIRNPEGPASEKAVAFLRSLGHDRQIGMTVEDFDGMLDVWIAAGITTAGFVSEQINEYKTAPLRPVKETEPGYYTLDGQYFVVVKNKAGTHTYAKQLTLSNPHETGGTWTWEYKPGAVKALGHLTPLSVEEAGKWGHLHGRCIICCRPLTDPKSVTNGIGPVCQKRLVK